MTTAGARVRPVAIPTYGHDEPVIGSIVFLGLLAVVALLLVVGRNRRR